MTLFEKSEYLTRLERTKDRMEKAGLDVLFVVDPANINYLTGYDAQSYYMEQAVIVGLEADEPIWIGRKMDVACGRFTAWLSPHNLMGYPEDLVNSRLKHPMSYIAGVMKERGMGKKTIGIEMDAPHFTPRANDALRANLPDAKFEDARLLVSWVRSFKSPAEIDLMKRAGVIADKVVQTAVDAIQVGVRECDAAAAVLYAQTAGTEEFGGDYSSLSPLFCAGVKASAPHLTWTDDRFESETSINLELAGVYRRYHCPISRTVYLGVNPPKKLAETAEYTIDALNAELEAMKPGATCEEVDQAWRKAMAHTGIVKESRTGYSMGIGYPPDWGEHTASLRKGDRTILQPGMAFHVISGIWMDDWGFEISQSAYVTETGYAPLSSTPRQFIVKN
jgi:Xaa-Pro dipeptidase